VTDTSEPLPARTLAVFHLAETSGPSRSLDAELKWLAEHGSLDVVVPGRGHVAERFEGVGTVITRDYGALTLPRDPRAAARVARAATREYRAFRRMIRERRPELVILASAMLPGALVAARRERVPTVVYAGELFAGAEAGPGSRAAGAAKALGAAALTRMVESLATGVMACSEAVAAQYAGAAVTTVYPPIGDSYAGGDREGTRDRLGIAAGEACVAAIGNITRNRGQDVLIRALPGMLAERPEVRCLIVGDPHPRAQDLAFRDRLDALARELGVEHAVTIAGHQERVADVYAAADVVANPRLSGEAFGRVPCEALVAGRPVVAMREGAVPEVLRDRETALLVPPGDPEALGEAALRLLGDPELAARLVAEGRRDVLRRFSPERSLAGFRQVVTAAMEAGGGRARDAR
jgi:Glycosyl transferases group 1/Glycosyltransferase Family 4